MLALGVLVRLILIPITHGDDFVVWDKASAATLRGVNIYQHHPDYPHGPFAYFPVFVYVELPFQWLAQHTALSFTIAGKLPILAADIACAVLIARELRDRGDGRRAATIGSALFFLNPLVLYNSAYYGRFDTLGLALLLVAYRGFTSGAGTSRRTATYYALAVAVKTFPVFAVVGVIRHARGARRRLVAIVAAVLVIVSLPYLGTLHAFVRDIVFWDAGKGPSGLSWQHVLLHLTDAHGAKLTSYGLLVVFAAGTVWLARIDDLARYLALCFVLFLVCSKVVLEQYLIWPMPWLVLLAWSAPVRLRRAAVALLALFTLAGLLDNESWHPWGRSPAVPDLILAVGCVAFLLIGVRESPRPGHRLGAAAGLVNSR
jgi:hypothetical protein